jgi:hypothetical protein
MLGCEQVPHSLVLGWIAAAEETAIRVDKAKIFVILKTSVV